MWKPLPGVTRRNLAREVLAGVTLLAIAVPLNIGYAQIAGLPATAGLYALIVPTLVYAVLVSSRQVVASPDAAAAALVFSSLTGLGVAGDDFIAMAGAQAILCGVFLIAASVLRLGFLANFLSQPILVGFVAGLAAEVLLSQVAKMLGLRLDPAGEFFPRVVELVTRLDETSVISLALSVAAVLVLLAGRRFAPALPGALIVLVIATLLTVWLHLDESGVAVLGAVEAGPPQFAFPTVGWQQWLLLIPSALALALITMAEGVLVSRSYGARRGYPVDADRDLFAFGAANVASGMSLSFSVGSSTSRTAAMDQLGSRTQIPSLVMAVGAFVLLLVGTDMLAQIPSPVIGAVVAVAIWKLLGIAELREIFRTSKYEFAVAAACLLGVLVLGPLQGLFLAFVLALINLARRASRPPIEVRAAASDPDVIVVRFAGPLFFANGAVLAERLDSATAGGNGPPVRGVVLDATTISDIDVTGAESLRGAIALLSDRGTDVVVAALTPRQRERFRRFGILAGAQDATSVDEGIAHFGR